MLAGWEPDFQSFWTHCSWGCMGVCAPQFSREVPQARLCPLPVVPPWAKLLNLSELLHSPLWNHRIALLGLLGRSVCPERGVPGNAFATRPGSLAAVGIGEHSPRPHPGPHSPLLGGHVLTSAWIPGLAQSCASRRKQDRPHTSTQLCPCPGGFSHDAFCKATGVSPRPGPAGTGGCEGSQLTPFL